MTFPFVEEDALNAIAVLERTISTPSPGITTSYGYNLNPGEITDPALLPAIVHVHRGPVPADDSPPGSRLSNGLYYIAYEIDSILMVIEVVPKKYPSDEGTANKFWASYLNTFMSATSKSSLATDSGAGEYRLILGDPSYGIVSWPKITPPIRQYWGYTFTHQFLFAGGGA